MTTEINKTNIGWRPELGVKRGEVIGITGVSSSGKSTFLQYLLSCLILDREFLTTKKNKEKAPNALWIETSGYAPEDFSSSLFRILSNDDDDKEIVLSKLKHITAHYEVITQSGVKNFCLRVNRDGKNQDYVINQLKMIIKNTKSDVIVIDSLKGLSFMDENQPNFADIIFKIKKLALRTNTLFFLILDKSNKSGETNLIRGNSAIYESIPNLWEIDANQNALIRDIAINIRKSNSVVYGNKYKLTSTLVNPAPEEELDPDFLEDSLGINFKNYDIKFTECFLNKTQENYIYKDGMLVAKRLGEYQPEEPKLDGIKKQFDHHIIAFVNSFVEDDESSISAAELLDIYNKELKSTGISKKINPNRLYTLFSAKFPNAKYKSNTIRYRIKRITNTERDH